MANSGVKGRIVYAATDVGIAGLKVVAVDIDDVPDEEFLGEKNTDSNGNFEINYAPDKYRKWQKENTTGPGEFSNPDIVLRIYTADLRLVYERAESKDVKDTILDVGQIEIHKNNVEGWLVTDSVLHPKIGDARRYEEDNSVEWLVDGAAAFPKLTDDVLNAKKSINLMNLNYWASDYLITKFHFKITQLALNKMSSKGLPANIVSSLSSLVGAVFTDEQLFVQTLQTWVTDPKHISLILKHASPPEGGKSEGVVLAAEMIKLAKKFPVRVLVNDVPFPNIGKNYDSLEQVTNYFKGSSVEVRGITSPGNTLMHGKGLVIDGEIAHVMGMTYSQSYHNDNEHLIRDPKRGQSDEIIHDVNVRVVGPAVKYVDQTFTALWNASNPSVSAVAPVTNQTKVSDGVAVQVLRTLPGGVFDASKTGNSVTVHGETSVLEGYQRAIANAEKLIYLESQYFTSPDIVTALICSLRSNSNREAIIVVPLKPDFPGYPELQTRYMKQLFAKAKEHNFEDRVAVFTPWSCQKTNKKFEIRPIYVHSKSGFVDDKWATVGSANLDGAGLNQTQARGIPIPPADIGLGLIGVGLFILALFYPIVWLFFAGYLLLEVVLSKKAGYDVDKKPTQHANPERSKQPDRSTELNVAVFNLSTPGNNKISELRDRLWSDHLGVPIADLPAMPPTGDKNWVAFWNRKADEKLKAIQAKKEHPCHILKWNPENDPEDYLEALGVAKDPEMSIKEKLPGSEQFDFKTGKWGT